MYPYALQFLNLGTFLPRRDSTPFPRVSPFWAQGSLKSPLSLFKKISVVTLCYGNGTNLMTLTLGEIWQRVQWDLSVLFLTIPWESANISKT